MMKKKKNKNDQEVNYVSVHIIQPYGHRLVIATPTSPSDNSEMEEIFNIEDSKSELCAVYKIEYEGWNAYLIVINFDHIQSITYGMISHEANHIVDFIMDAIGQKVDPNNNEYSAYLLEWIVNTIFQHIEERNLLKELSTESKIVKTDGTD